MRPIYFAALYFVHNQPSGGALEEVEYFLAQKIDRLVVTKLRPVLQRQLHDAVWYALDELTIEELQ